MEAKVCSNTQHKLCLNEDCKICEKRSFLSHPKSKFWSKKNILKPREVFKSSHTKYQFECDKDKKICPHEFEKSLNDVNEGKWCPFCSNTKLCSNKNCAICLDKSFASHPRAIFWHKTKNTLNPREVFKNSHKEYWFKCDKGVLCPHEFKLQLNCVNMGRWCSFCGNKQLCNNKNSIMHV